MPSFISQIKIVDLKRSVVDKSKSDPKQGNYEFKSKVYVERADYFDALHRPPWKFKWNRYEPRTNYKEVRDWQIKYGASFVDANDPYWPEGVPPDSEGKYVFGDLVLMKIPLKIHLEKRAADVARSEKQTASALTAFKENIKRRLGKDAIDESLIRDYLD